MTPRGVSPQAVPGRDEGHTGKSKSDSGWELSEKVFSCPCFLPPHPSSFSHQVDFLFLPEVSLSAHAVLPVVLSRLQALVQDPHTTRITTTWETALFIFQFLKKRSFVSTG